MKKSLLTRNNSGFTLIEILVVISIIGILIAIGLASYVTIQQKARDSRRKSDVQVIAQALEQYFSDIDTTSKAVRNTYPLLCSGASSYISGPWPTDPKSGIAYPCYVDGANQAAFCVCATMEGGGGNASAYDSSTGVCTYGSGNLYCKSNVQ